MVVSVVPVSIYYSGSGSSGVGGGRIRTPMEAIWLLYSGTGRKHVREADTALTFRTAQKDHHTVDNQCGCPEPGLHNR